MLLEGRNAVIYGPGGLGAGVARTFAREAARVFLAGRAREPLAGSITGTIVNVRCGLVPS